jgi:hypothetical protein
MSRRRGLRRPANRGAPSPLAAGGRDTPPCPPPPHAMVDAPPAPAAAPPAAGEPVDPAKKAKAVRAGGGDGGRWWWSRGCAIEWAGGRERRAMGAAPTLPPSPLPRRTPSAP